MRTMKTLIAALACAAFLAVASVGAYAAPAQEKCPVMGYTVNEKLYVDHEGKRVYFCCESCPSQFKKDPDKYMKKMEEEGVTLEDAPAS